MRSSIANTALGALVALGALGACGRSPREDLGAIDLAAASTRIRELVVDCRGMARALDVLATSRLPSRSLLGLVDETVELGRAKCRDMAVAGSAPPHRLARARLAAQPAEALAALGPAAPADAVAIQLRRSELLEALGRPAEALVALTSALAREASAPDRARELPLRVAAAAAAGKLDEASALVTRAPIEQRIALANRLVAHAPAARLTAIAREAPLEVAIAAADRVEQTAGAAAAVDARQRASSLAPDDADLLDALARSLAAAGRLDEAIAAWDRAAAIAPAQPAFRIAPIRALAASSAEPTGVSGQRTDASADPTRVSGARTKARVDRLVDEARAGDEPERYITAAHAAVAAGDPARAVTVMREARAKRPSDGRLAFELALRLVDANDRTTAIDAFVELLVCGAHGRAWHRHEIAGRLVALASDVASKQHALAALDRTWTCTPAEAADLATYTTALRAQLAK